MSPLPDNLVLLDACRKELDRFIEPYYEKEHLVITIDPRTQNDLMRANTAILNAITAYGEVMGTAEQRVLDGLIHKIMRALETPEINNSEFTSYWEVNDVSFSIYRGLRLEEQVEFLHEIVRRYLRKRHGMYQAHGYTPTTLQVKADSFAHKRSGGLGLDKVEAMLKESGFVRHHGEVEAFARMERAYALPDRGDARLFDAWLQRYGVVFQWGADHRGKRPDFLLRAHNTWIVVEHKHMKECGGGQDKQIMEVTGFVSHAEAEAASVYYVSFVDGILFDRLASCEGGKKLRAQGEKIRSCLSENKRNYFVNTWGFLQLLRGLDGA